MIRAKVICNQVLYSADQNGNKYQEQVKFSAVYGEEGTANKQWSKWTPSAQFEMYINNPDAFDKFRVGQFYFVDFTPTTKEA